MNTDTKIMPVQMAGGEIVHFEVRALGGEENIASTIPSFEAVNATIRALCKEVLSSIREASPTKASVEFGVEVAAESGALTALVVKGTGKATIKITLEWAQAKQ